MSTSDYRVWGDSRQAVFHEGEDRRLLGRLEWAPGHYFADNANSLSVDPYALLGLRVGYDPGRRWSFYVEGRNLTDKRYISTVAIAGTASESAEIFNPGIGRAVFGGVRVKW